MIVQFVISNLSNGEKDSGFVELSSKRYGSTAESKVVNGRTVMAPWAFAKKVQAMMATTECQVITTNVF